MVDKNKKRTLIQCLETGEIFPSALAACEWLNKRDNTPGAKSAANLIQAAKKGFRAYGCSWNLIKEEHPTESGETYIPKSSPIKCLSHGVTFFDVEAAVNYLKANERIQITNGGEKKKALLDLTRAASFRLQYAGLSWKFVEKDWSEI